MSAACRRAAVLAGPRRRHSAGGRVPARVLVVAVLAAAPVSATVAVPVVARAGDGSDPRAVAALANAARAARERGWAGTQYSAVYGGPGSASAVLRLRHVAGRGTYVVVASGDGAGHVPVLALDPSGAPALAVSGVDGRQLPLLEQAYDLVLDPGQARCVVARRRDGRVAARLWLDPVTGLVARRELYGGDGRVVRGSVFVDLRLTADTAAETTERAARSGTGTSGAVVGDGPTRTLSAVSDGEQRLDGAALHRWEATGWVVPRELPAGLALYDARQQRVDGEDVLHLAYSDGLSTVSLFEERGSLDAGAVRGWHPQGRGAAAVYWDASSLTPRAAWSGGGRTWTMLADSPLAQARQVVAALPHRHDRRGLLGRLADGLGRLCSWVTGLL